MKKLLKKIIPKSIQPKIKRALFRIWNFGDAFYCPVCQSKVRWLKPCGYNYPVIREYQIVGGGLRNTLCPVCGSSDRVRLLFLFLRNKTDLFTHPVKLLHIAPEKSLMEILIKQSNIDYLTADLKAENVMIKMDITQIQYPNDSFDAILCNHVLEHISDDKKAMNELFRVLKPGGWAILQVPYSQILNVTFEDFTIVTPEEREKHFGQQDHVRIYGLDYSQRLQGAGFAVEEFRWILDQRFINQKNNFGLNENEIIFYCIKKS